MVRHAQSCISLQEIAEDPKSFDGVIDIGNNIVKTKPWAYIQSLGGL